MNVMHASVIEEWVQDLLMLFEFLIISGWEVTQGCIERYS